jgi:hypothetical protein
VLIGVRQRGWRRGIQPGVQWSLAALCIVAFAVIPGPGKTRCLMLVPAMLLGWHGMRSIQRGFVRTEKPI